MVKPEFTESDYEKIATEFFPKPVRGQVTGIISTMARKLTEYKRTLTKKDLEEFEAIKKTKEMERVKGYL